MTDVASRFLEGGAQAFREAAARIAPHVRVTPLVQMSGCNLWLKPESLHPVGAFKLRGAFNMLLSLTPEEKARGVIAHSSGNHAQAVAYAASKLGVKAVVVMPSNAPQAKVEGTRRWGAEIVTVGPASRERAAKAQELSQKHGYTQVPPFDSLHIIAGTATIALEILTQHPDVQVIAAPVSGGGLLAGVALATKSLRPDVKVIGVEPELAGDAAASLRAGSIVEFSAEEVGRTMADGLRVQRLGEKTWPIIQACVDDIVTVTEDQIRAAMRQIAEEAHLIAEPSGAVAIAGALKIGTTPHRTVAILSGGNVSLDAFAGIIG
jgi:threonine dehydratase